MQNRAKSELSLWRAAVMIISEAIGPKEQVFGPSNKAFRDDGWHSIAMTDACDARPRFKVKFESISPVGLPVPLDGEADLLDYLSDVGSEMERVRAALKSHQECWGGREEDLLVAEDALYRLQELEARAMKRLDEVRRNSRDPET